MIDKKAWIFRRAITRLGNKAAKRFNNWAEPRIRRAFEDGSMMEKLEEMEKKLPYSQRLNKK